MFFGDNIARWTTWRQSGCFYPEMIPEPDYSESESDESDSEESEESDKDSDATRGTDDNDWKNRGREGKRDSSPLSKSESMEDELIRPKKPSNPYLESLEMQQLHKELRFNQKYGNNNGNRKTELQTALEKYTETKIKKDLASSKQTSLERILARQARKIEMHERDGTREQRRPAWIDRLQRQQIIKYSDPKSNEFFRVHARVVSNLMDHGVSSAGDTRSEYSKSSASSTSQSDSEE